MSTATKTRKAIEKLNQRLERLQIEWVPVGSIKPNEYNPNRQSDHEFELLVTSILEDGFTQPILCQRQSREIIDGFHRWRAAQDPRIAMDEVPVVFTDVPAAQARMSTLRHNRARGSEDIELVAQVLRELEALDALDWAQESLLMDDIEIQRLLNDVAAPEAMASEEFSQAWEPMGTHQASSEDGQERDLGGARAYEGSTLAAADRQRAAEKALVDAKSEEERQAVMRDRAIYRIALTFTDDEARVVKQALGDKPAEKLLRMCRREIETVTNNGEHEEVPPVREAIP